jgi:hypothetical protein
MRIIDCWYSGKDGKTAIYCDNINGIDISKATKAIIGKMSYKIIGYDAMTSITGAKNAMLLLDTTKEIAFPQEIELQ